MARYEKENSGSWAGVILVTIFTVAAFLLIVALTKVVDLEALGKRFEQSHPVATVSQGEPAEEQQSDSMVGSYKATSAVYNGIEMNSLMLTVSGYKITFDVREDGSFTANLNDDTYEGSWYRDGSYVEFYSGDLALTGEYSNGVISLSDASGSMAVVLE